MYPVEHATAAAPAVNLMALLGKTPLHARLRGQTRPPVKNMNAALSAGGPETLPQKLSFLAEQIGPAVATLGRTHFGRAAKPMGSPRVGSNPTGVVRVQSGFVWKANTLQVWGGMI